jgi:Protein of unknown function (DUF2877)
VRLLQVGLGAAEALARPGPGAVTAVYRRAAYLRLPGGIVAVVAPDVPSGPLWIRGDGLHGDLRPGQPVTVGREWLDVAGQRLSTAGVSVWRGELPDPVDLRGNVGFAGDVLAVAPPSALLADPWRRALGEGEAAIRRGDLLAVASALGGLGPGLTPAGDDALAGILLAHRALDGNPDERLLLAAAQAASTTDLSAALLCWAARGQAVEPVHVLLGAIAARDETAAIAAVTRVSSLGSSSGADLLLGLRLGLEWGVSLRRRSPV